MSQPLKTQRAKTCFGGASEVLINGFLRFRYSGFSLIRSDLAVAAGRRSRPFACLSPRSRWLKDLRRFGVEVDQYFMLPSLRFLFVAVVLSLSMMIFGLGAASLLRSAQQEVANLPTRHVQPETVLAREPEAAMPTLAMLRLDPPAAEHRGTGQLEEPDAPTQSSPTAAAEPAPTATDKPATQASAPPSEQKSDSIDRPLDSPLQAAAAGFEAPLPPEHLEPETPKQEIPRQEIPKQATQATVDAEPARSVSAAAAAPAAETILALRATAPTAPPVAPVAAPMVPAAAPVTWPTTAAAAPETTTASPEATAALPEPPTTAKAPTEPTDEGAKAVTARIATLGTLTAPAEPQTASKAAAAKNAKREQARQLARRRRIVRARMLLRPAEQPVAAQPSQPTPAQFFLVARPGGGS